MTTPSVSAVQPLVTFLHGPDTVDYTPSADVAAGDVVVLGGLVGVAKVPIPSGTLGALAIRGVFVFPKSGSDSGATVGALAYWDATNKVATSTSTDNTLMGKFELAAATADTTARVTLLP